MLAYLEDIPTAILRIELGIITDQIRCVKKYGNDLEKGFDLFVMTRKKLQILVELEKRDQNGNR